MRKEVRSFALDAITECEQLSLEAKKLDSELLRNSMQSGYGIFGGVVKNWAKLKFTPERTRWVKHEEWHPDQVGTIQNDGSYVLEIPYSDERELIGDLLKHGSSVEVLSPLDLRKKVKDEIQKAIRVYE